MSRAFYRAAIYAGKSPQTPERALFAVECSVFFARSAFTNSLSLAMNRASIGAIRFVGFEID
jgi:hypothetical protein